MTLLTRKALLLLNFDRFSHTQQGSSTPHCPGLACENIPHCQDLFLNGLPMTYNPTGMFPDLCTCEYVCLLTHSRPKGTIVTISFYSMPNSSKTRFKSLLRFNISLKCNILPFPQWPMLKISVLQKSSLPIVPCFLCIGLFPHVYSSYAWVRLTGNEQTQPVRYSPEIANNLLSYPWIHVLIHFYFHLYML